MYALIILLCFECKDGGLYTFMLTIGFHVSYRERKEIADGPIISFKHYVMSFIIFFKFCFLGICEIHWESIVSCHLQNRYLLQQRGRLNSEP